MSFAFRSLPTQSCRSRKNKSTCAPAAPFIQVAETKGYGQFAPVARAARSVSTSVPGDQEANKLEARRCMFSQSGAALVVGLLRDLHASGLGHATAFDVKEGEPLKELRLREEIQ
jgi:hypothetical protein